MVALLLLILSQAPQPAPAPPAPAAATQAPKPRAAAATQAPKPRAAAAAANLTLVLFVTDTSGRNLEGVTVALTGPIDREMKTPAGTGLRIANLRAGIYRARFARDGFYTFEKEIVLRAGPAAELSVALNAAPPPPPLSPPPPPVAAPTPAAATPSRLPPPGAPKALSLPDFIENNFISGREGHKENIVGCSGVGQAVLWQVRDPWEGRQHDSADGMLYVIGGEGTIKIDGRDASITAGSFAVIPRGTTYGFTRRGRNPLIVLAVLAGAPCAAE